MNPLLVAVVALFPQYSQISAYLDAFLNVPHEVRTFLIDLLQFPQNLLLLVPQFLAEFLVVGSADFLMDDIPFLHPIQLPVDFLEPFFHDFGFLELLGIHLDHGRFQLLCDERNEFILDRELSQFSQKLLAKAVGIHIAFTFSSSAIVVRQRVVASLSILFLGDVAREGFAAMLTDQELFEGKGIVLLIDGIAVVVVGFEDSIHR